MSINFFFHILIEFGPLTLFFFISSIYGFYPGAMALVASVLLTTLFSIYYFRRISIFSLLVSSFIFVCGVATIYLHDPFWLVLEYTVTNLIFAAAQFYGHYKNKLILKSLFGHMFAISDNGWRRLSWNWAVCFLVTGVLNQLFWVFYPDENLWTAFRFVSTVCMFIFGVAQFKISREERLEGSSPWGLRQ